MTTDTAEPEVIATLPGLDPAAVADVKLEVVETHPDGSMTVQTPSVAENGPGVSSEASETPGGSNTPRDTESRSSEPVGVPGEVILPLTPDQIKDSIAREKALVELYEVQDRLKLAIEDHNVKAKVAKNAKEFVEVLQANFYSAVTNVRDCNKPLPLFDKPKPAEAKKEAARQEAKAEVNATFPAPEAIQPLPADNIDEFYRRKRRRLRSRISV